MAEGPLERRPRDADLPEERRNDLLRRVDWRFLLRCPERPRVIDLAPGWDSDALRLVSAQAGPREAEVAVIGFPGRTSLRAARNALAPGGEVVCRWRAPRLGGVQRRQAAAGPRRFPRRQALLGGAAAGPSASVLAAAATPPRRSTTRSPPGPRARSPAAACSASGAASPEPARWRPST